MKIITPSARLLTYTFSPETIIERAGRIAYRSEDKITAESAGSFCRKLIKLGHESVLEHASATFIFENMSRAASHQLVRHRMASYTQESQRYVSQEPEVVIPKSIKECAEAVKEYASTMNTLFNTYAKLCALVKKEDARYVLPNATTTSLVITANFRQWRHMLELRGSLKAQEEIRTIFIKAFTVLHTIATNVFYDFTLYHEPEPHLVKNKGDTS